MKYDYLIIGQGICGTWLSYYLLHENKSVFVIDDADKSAASKIASGLINPVTGRRVVTTWMADELLPFVWNEYNAISKKFDQQFIQQKNIIAFPSAPNLLQAFEKRKQQGNSYIYESSLKKETLYKFFDFPFDVMEIAPCYLVDVNAITKTWRQYLENKNALVTENFNEEELLVLDGYIQYKNITAEKIIYCNGINASLSKYWKQLPFVPNKGQALIADIKDLSTDYIYKFGHLLLIPWQNNLWWIGASNELNFINVDPTDEFLKSTIATLDRILKTDFKIKDHVSSVRPAAVERRPFVGIHSLYNQIAILNGMGSKGCSLAPWFAKELAANLINKKTINILADVKRYAGVLKR
ncbi:MAG TPA: FAD-dependent oxidoreductase [Parafilimonas sp.]|nr:FAD-dependent oxidoreductase [Parafilimonas sp.]